MILSRTRLRFFVRSCKLLYSKIDMLPLLLGRSTSLYGNSYDAQQINFEQVTFKIGMYNAEQLFNPHHVSRKPAPSFML